LTNLINIVFKNAIHNGNTGVQLFPTYYTKALDVHFTPEWMGHDCSKTTEIDTHVSKNDFQKFNNPIDDMNCDDG